MHSGTLSRLYVPVGPRCCCPRQKRAAMRHSRASVGEMPCAKCTDQVLRQIVHFSSVTPILAALIAPILLPSLLRCLWLLWPSLLWLLLQRCFDHWLHNCCSHSFVTALFVSSGCALGVLTSTLLYHPLSVHKVVLFSTSSVWMKKWTLSYSLFVTCYYI